MMVRDHDRLVRSWLARVRADGLSGDACRLAKALARAPRSALMTVEATDDGLALAAYLSPARYDAAIAELVQRRRLERLPCGRFALSEAPRRAGTGPPSGKENAPRRSSVRGAVETAKENSPVYRTPVRRAQQRGSG